MARKKKQQDEGGGYNYMDTYGDLVTLLLCFFVLLYASSSMDTQKWQELIMALSQGGASVVLDPIDPGEPRLDLDEQSEESDGDSAEQMDIDRRFSELYKKMKAYVVANQLEAEVEVEKFDTFIKVRFIEDDILFKSGSAELSESATPILNDVGKIILEHEGSIESVEVEGHTDNRPISNALYPNNWYLSSMRAMNVLNKMLYQSENAGKFDEEKYCSIGRGEYHPIDTNETTQGQARNRRVEFLITERVIPLNQSEY